MNFVKVATKSEIPEGTVKVFTVDGHRVAVCHAQGDEVLYAIADLCTHDNGPLGEGELDDHQIECPRHGARFDVKSGKALCLPAVLAVPTYEVEMRGEEVWVAVKAAVKG